jgi:hypothetical protein
MAETGWPLIPREVLPAPTPPARRARRRPAHVDGGRQLPIFGAGTIEPSPADLAGLLAGPGRLDRMGGTARVSIRVDAAWRVHVLVGELVSRGLVVSWLPVQEAGPQPVRAGAHDPLAAGDAEPVTADDHEHEAALRPEPGAEDTGAGGHALTRPVEPPVSVTSFEVRTAYSSRLTGLARAWPPPADRLFLSGPRLRLWVAAAGEPRPGAYSLALGPDGDRDIVDAALSRAGLAGVLSDAGRRYLISGRRRLARLAELVGERPAAAPESLWPGGAAA